MKRWAPTFAPIGALILAGSLALAGCGSSDGGTKNADGTRTLRVAFTPGFGTLPVHLAESEGFFKDHGLDVKITEGLDLATWAGALDKQFDVVMSTAPIFLSAVQHLPLVAVAGTQINVADPKNSVLMTKDDSIQSVADLKGKRVGVPALTGASAIGLQYLAHNAGLEAADLKLVQVPFAEQMAQLDAGNIDAAVSAIPFYTPMEAAGYRAVLDTQWDATKAATGVDESANAFFLATDSFAKKNAETLTAFKAAIADAVRFIGEHEAAARTEGQKWLGLPPELSQKAPIPGLSAEITPAQLKPWIAIFKQMGILEKDLNAEDLIWTH